MRFALAITVLALALPAQAHIHDRPELDTWVGQLQSRGGAGHAGGLCCDYAEATRIDDVDWKVADQEQAGGKVECKIVPNEHDTAYRGEFCVRVDGEWWLVPDWAVVDKANRYGEAMLWPILTTEGWDKKPGSTSKFIGIRCFMPGAGT